MAFYAHISLRLGLVAIQLGPIGIWGIVLPGLVVLLVLVAPIVAFAKARSVGELAPAAVTELYADALAIALKVPRHERRRIPHIISSAIEIRDSGALADAEMDTLLGSRYMKERLHSLDEAVHAAFTISEWSDGSGPTGAPASFLAQIIAVAEAWSALTGQGGPQLSHEEALYELRSWAGTRYDAKIIDAAASIVRRERRLTGESAFQPRVHRLHHSMTTSSWARLFLLSGFLVRDGSARPGTPSDRVGSDAR